MNEFDELVALRNEIKWVQLIQYELGQLAHFEKWVGLFKIENFYKQLFVLLFLAYIFLIIDFITW